MVLTQLSAARIPTSKELGAREDERLSRNVNTAQVLQFEKQIRIERERHLDNGIQAPRSDAPSSEVGGGYPTTEKKQHGGALHRRK